MQPINNTQYIGGRDVTFWKLGDDKDTGVMVVPSFAILGHYESACDRRFILDAYFGLKNLTEAGVKRLLVDTTDNGGGELRFSQDLQRLLVGPSLDKYNALESFLAKTDLTQAMTKKDDSNETLALLDGEFSPHVFRKWGETEDLPINDNFFEPGTVQQINGHTLQLSNGIADTLDALHDWEHLLGNPDAFFSPENIKFTGNGLCGSACASFTNLLIEYWNATAIINNPQPEKPTEFTAFAAGQSSSNDDVVRELASIGLLDLFPTQYYRMYFGFPIRAAMSSNVAPGQFTQYRSYPAQQRFSLTRDQWEKPHAAWLEAARLWE